MKKLLALTLGILLMEQPHANAQDMIQKKNITLKSDLMTPEALWAM